MYLAQFDTSCTVVLSHGHLRETGAVGAVQSKARLRGLRGFSSNTGLCRIPTWNFPQSRTGLGANALTAPPPYPYPSSKFIPLHSSGLGAIVCKSRATHRALITCKCRVTCHLVRRGSSAIKFDRVEIAFI